MDPITHTLVGFSLAETGLKARTRLATATLVIGANLPDVDVLAYFWGPDVALAVRRGITHGLPALVAWPFVLAAGMSLWNMLASRRRRHLCDEQPDPMGDGCETNMLASRRRRHLCDEQPDPMGDGCETNRMRPSRAPDERPFSFRATLLLAAIAIWSHPSLDFLNNYGMRWLMPMKGTWFYGDTLFIVDPFVWVGLAVGIHFARRRGVTVSTARGNPGHWGGRQSPALVALFAFLVYIVLMAVSMLAARAAVRQQFTAATGTEPFRLMISPVFANPFAKFVVIEDAARYYAGTFRWLRGTSFEWRPLPYDKVTTKPPPASVASQRAPRNFLSWARFPYVEEQAEGNATVIRLGDARYTLTPGGSWATVSVRLKE